MKTVTIEGQLRSEVGKKATRQLRSEGKTPGVIYGGPKEINFSAPESDFRDLVYTPYFQVAEVKIGDKTYKCVLKDLQFHPVTEQLLHVDLVELVDNKKVIVTLPITFEGQAKGVVLQGGRLRTRLKTLKVKAYPKDLIEDIVINVSDMGMDDSIRVGDLKEENIEILNSPRVPIVSVTATRAARLDDLTTTAVDLDEEEEEETTEKGEAEEKAEE